MKNKNELANYLSEKLNRIIAIKMGTYKKPLDKKSILKELISFETEYEK